MNLNNAVLMKDLFDLKDGRLESRSSSISISIGIPERLVGVIFGFEDIGEKFVLCCGNFPGCIQDKTLIDFWDVPDAQPSLFRLADIFPGTEMKGESGVFFLNTCPPKIPDDRSNFREEGF